MAKEFAVMLLTWIAFASSAAQFCGPVADGSLPMPCGTAVPDDDTSELLQFTVKVEEQMISNDSTYDRFSKSVFHDDGNSSKNVTNHHIVKARSSMRPDAEIAEDLKLLWEPKKREKIEKVVKPVEGHGKEEAMMGEQMYRISVDALTTLLGTLGKQQLRFSKLLELRQRWHSARVVLIFGLATNIVLNPAVNGLSFYFAPQSMLAPSLGMGVIWNCVLAPFTLKESLTRGRLLGCFILCAGMIGTALHGPPEASSYSLDKFGHLLSRPRAFAYYFAEISLILAGTMYILWRRAGHGVRGLVLGILGGVIGGNLFFFKGTFELVFITYYTESFKVWFEPLHLFLAIGTLACTVTTTCLLVYGCREHESLSMVATYSGAFVVSGCVSDWAVMAEMDGQAPARVSDYVSSLFFIMLGIFLVEAGDPARAVMSP